MIELPVTVNGRLRNVAVEAGETLLTVLRDRLGLLGTKEGCVEGECGACTVLLDGAPVDSCIYAAAATAHRHVTTIEGIAPPEELSAIQEAFVAAGGVQCGFCTPGFIVTLTALLEQNPEPTSDEIKVSLSGNICRCTGYTQIIEAALSVATGAVR